MDKINPNKINDILIVRIGKIGDIIATSFVFEVIKRNNPSTRISLITSSGNKNVLQYNRSLDTVYYVDSGIKRYFQLFRLRKKKFDLIIDFNDNPSKTTKMIFSSYNADIKAGYDFPLYSHCLDIKIKQPEKENSHIIDRMAYFLESIGYNFSRDQLKPVIYVGSEEENSILAIIKSHRERKPIGVNISAGAEIRFWEPKRWVELIRRINKLNNEFYFVLLYVNENKNPAEEIVNKLNGIEVIAPEPETFQHFAAWIKNSYLLISPDTSAVHAAASFKVPVLALYPNSGWNFASWRPYNTPCRAIHSAGESVNSISIDEVFDNFVELNKEILENG